MNGTLNNAISNNQVEAPNSLNIQEFPPGERGCPILNSDS